MVAAPDWNILISSIPAARRKIVVPYHIRSSYDADDAIGDSLLIISQRPDYFDYSSPVGLLVFLARGAISVERRRPRHRANVMPLPISTGRSESEADLPDRPCPPSCRLEVAEILASILDLCHDRDERGAIVLRSLGYDRSEVASILGWNVSTVYRLIGRLGRASGLSP